MEQELKFARGDRVKKTKGSSWTGHVVGFYETGLTPVGYCVESENEPGSVQIYPASALAAAPPAPSGAGAEIEAVAWLVSPPDDDYYGTGPSTLRFCCPPEDQRADGYTAIPLVPASSLATLQAEVERLTNRAIDAENDRDRFIEGKVLAEHQRDTLASELAQLKQQLAERPGVRHFDILAEAMAEVKATSDGDSTQPIADIVAGCLAEIDALPDSRRARRTLSPSEREAGDA